MSNQNKTTRSPVYNDFRELLITADKIDDLAEYTSRSHETLKAYCFDVGRIGRTAAHKIYNYMIWNGHIRASVPIGDVFPKWAMSKPPRVPKREADQVKMPGPLCVVPPSGSLAELWLQWIKDGDLRVATIRAIFHSTQNRFTKENARVVLRNAPLAPKRDESGERQAA